MRSRCAIAPSFDVYRAVVEGCAASRRCRRRRRCLATALSRCAIPTAGLPCSGPGRVRQAAPADGPAADAGPLQHVVAAARLPAMMAFYDGTLGFLESYICIREGAQAHDGETNVSFSAPMEAPQLRGVPRARVPADHHAYETTGWSDLRQWADHIASLRGAARGGGRAGTGRQQPLLHGPGPPRQPSRALGRDRETMKKGQPGRKWMGARRATNLWGEPWIRDTGDVVANAQLVRPRSLNSGTMC